MILRGSFMSFESLKKFRKTKDELRKLTGSDEAYKSVLARFQIEHADEIMSDEQKENTWRALDYALNQARWDSKEESSELLKPSKVLKFNPFTWQEQFTEIQKHLLWLTGDHVLFFAILKRYGYGEIKEIKDRKSSLAPYRELCAERNRIQMERGLKDIDKELNATLRDAQFRIGPLYWDILGRDFGCAENADVFKLEADQLARLLARLRDEVLRMKLT